MITNGMNYEGNPGIDATKKIPDESFKRTWPPFIKVDESVKAKINSLFSPGH